MKKNIRERFWSKVDKSGDCWEWMAAKAGKGYGVLSIDGRMQYAHRTSWQIANGNIPEGMLVCHSCDNPPCVNPDHLWLGTNADNLADMAAKGRSTKGRPCNPGEAHWKSKLTNDDVRTIRYMLTLKTILQREIAECFSIGVSAIGEIKSRRRWSHI